MVLTAQAPKMEMALPRCTAMDRCWTRCVATFSSPVSYLNLLLNSLTKANDQGPKALEDSTAIGTNSCAWSRSEYFSWGR